MADELPNVTITEGQTKKPNPLQGYYRQPKIYIKLPSKGVYYGDALDASENGEYPVYAMTAKDELLLKTPDALLSGQSTVEVIKSCVPAIKNPWVMPTIDLDAVLMAIRIATYGKDMDFFANCPKCETENKYTLPLVDHLGRVQQFQFQPTVQVGTMIVHIKPFTYKQMTDNNLKALEQQRVFSVINDEKLSDSEKMTKFNESFVKLTTMTVDMITQCVDKIEVPEGSVSDPEQIKEFLENTTSEIFNGLKTHIEETRQGVNVPDQKVQCENEECKHNFTVPVTLDQSDFFERRS